MRRNAGGSGLTGMAERAAQLGASFRAGPVDRSWVVRVELPRGDLATDGHVCPLPRLSRAVPTRRRGAGMSLPDDALIRVLLVDDQELVRSGLTRILRRRDGFLVVGECEDGDQVVAAVEEHRPDVVVMDLRMRRMSGIDATARSVVARTPRRSWCSPRSTTTSCSPERCERVPPASCSRTAPPRTSCAESPPWPPATRSSTRP